MLTRKNDRDYFLEQVPEMVGSETASTRRSRKHRELRGLHCNTIATTCNGDIDIEKDIDTEIEKDVDENPVSLIVEGYQSRIAPLDGNSI